MRAVALEATFPACRAVITTRFALGVLQPAAAQMTEKEASLGYWILSALYALRRDSTLRNHCSHRCAKWRFALLQKVCISHVLVDEQDDVDFCDLPEAWSFSPCIALVFSLWGQEKACLSVPAEVAGWAKTSAAPIRAIDRGKHLPACPVL